MAHSSTTPIDINGDDETKPLINSDRQVQDSIENFLAVLNDFLSQSNEASSSDTPPQVLKDIEAKLIEKINAQKPGWLSPKWVNAIHTVVAYCAAFKGVIGAAALIELAAGLIIEKTDQDMDNSPVWGPMLAAEVIIGVLALTLNLPFYFKNVRDGLVALNIATPASMHEIEIREKMAQMSWSRYFLSFGLAIGAGLGQAGMVSLSTFFLEKFQIYASIPLEAAKWFFAAPVGIANVVMYLPKTDKAIVNLEALFVRDQVDPTDPSGTRRIAIPWSARMLQALEYAASVVAVVPNVLGAGAIFSEQMQVLAPGIQKMIIFISGTLMSIGPIGLNADELEKLTQAKDGFLAQIKAKWGGYVGAAVSAAFSCIFTYKLVQKVFGESAGATVTAATLTLFNSLFLILTKGNPFSEHYRGTRCNNLFQKLFAGSYPCKAEERWNRLMKSVEKLGALTTASSSKDKTKAKNIFLNDFTAFIALIPEVREGRRKYFRTNLIELAEAFVQERLEKLPQASRTVAITMGANALSPETGLRRLDGSQTPSSQLSRANSVVSFAVP